MSATNRSAVRHAGDFYRTPAWVVSALLESEPLHGPILEPACGDGAILKQLIEQGTCGADDVLGVEIDPGRARAAASNRWGARVVCGNFLEGLDCWQHLEPRPCAVITNPPYRQAAEFVRRSLEVVQPGGRVCMLLRLNFLGSSRKRLDVVGPGSGLARVIVLAKRPSFTGGGTDACEYAWMIWIRGHAGEARISVCTEGTTAT